LAAQEVRYANANSGFGKRVCLFTGASGTLGRSFCRVFAHQYDIVAVCRNRTPRWPSQHEWQVDPLEPQTRIPENDHPVFVVRADLEQDEELERVVELALARFDRIDMVVNAAAHSVWAPLVDSDRALDSAARQFRINTLVPARLAVLIARAFWRDRDQENRAFNRNVVNVSSTAGIRVHKGMGQSIYSASKVGLNYLTRHMAHEFSRFGVRVNALAPDSFPGRVPTRKVVRALAELDQAAVSGRVLVVEPGGKEFR
jgi:NAD(P)-dependent dehydrogenase (short-subunit alcohol dehydrogenase family)